MPGTYPSKPLVFLIADSLVNQAGGKITIIGAFAAGQILVPPGSSFPAVMPLAVYAVFDDGEGTFKTTVRILDSNDKQIGDDISLGNSVKILGLPLQVALAFNLFQFPVQGTYKVDILFDDHVYTNNISIRVSEKPIS